MRLKAILVGLATALAVLACGGSDPEVDLEQANRDILEGWTLGHELARARREAD